MKFSTVTAAALSALYITSPALGDSLLSIAGSGGAVEMIKDDGTKVTMTTLQLESLLALEARVGALEAEKQVIVETKTSQPACASSNKGTNGVE